MPQLIPFSSLLCGFNVLVSTFCASSIWLRRRDLLESDPLVKRFYFAFVYSSAQFFWNFLPGTLVKDPYFIQIIYTFSDVTIMLIAMYMLSIPLNTFPQTQRLRQFVKIASRIVMAFSVFYVAYNLWVLKPVTVVTYGYMIDWRSSVSPALQLIIVSLCAIFIISTALFFFFRGWWHENDLIRRRSRILAVGFFAILLGWIGVSFFNTSTPQSPGIVLLVGTIGVGTMSLGFVALLWAVFTRNKPGHQLTRPSAS